MAAGDGDGPSLWARVSQLATTLTNLFPVFVLGAAVWALMQPAAFDWFEKSAITPVLALTMVSTPCNRLRAAEPPRRACLALHAACVPLLSFFTLRCSWAWG